MTIILTIYFIWLLNQVFNLIIFLNYVVAVLSDVYETVMDQQHRFIYSHRQSLNDEFECCLDIVKHLDFWRYYAYKHDGIRDWNVITDSIMIVSDENLSEQTEF